jgi:transposase
MLQPPYSPDLAPCDSFLFQKVKSAVKGYHFESTEGIQRAVTQALKDIPQAVFQECYNDSTTGKGVCRHKGCTLKVTTL